MVIWLRRPKAIVMDVEGTTSSIRFWSEVFIPYVNKHLEGFLTSQWGQEGLMDTVNRVRRQASRDRALGAPQVADQGEGKDEIIRTVNENVLWQMETNRYSTSLKQMQLILWMYGYQLKHLQSHVFDDVPAALEKWRDEGIKLYTFSSGLSKAQRLFFSSTTHGNLTSVSAMFSSLGLEHLLFLSNCPFKLIDGYFDKRQVGSKTESDSFEAIANRINVQPMEILFLSDKPKEVNSAKEGGLNAVLVSRAENRPLTDKDRGGNQVVLTFDEISFL